MNDKDTPEEQKSNEQNIVGDEVSLTHSFTNYLNALYQGKFVYLNILQQGNHPGFSEKEFSETKAILENTASWRKRLFDGETIFPKPSTEKKVALSDEAKRIMALLEAMRPSNFHSAQNLETILLAKNLENNSTHITELVASFARFTYTRENYLAGGLNFAHHFGINSVIDEATFYLQLAQQDIQLAHTFMNAVENFDVCAKRFIDVIIGESKILPGAFKIFNNDIVGLLHSYESFKSFELFGFSPSEISAWKANSIDPETAADWKAHRISPGEAIKWMMLNSPFAHSPTVAAAWQIEGFNPETFLPWAEKGIRPYIAKLWVEAGYNAEEANNFTSQGYLTPEVMPKSTGSKIPVEADDFDAEDQ
ncbi:MAG: hypothetical protein KDD56_08050 [Bdellovibrionales bacterium]|nr:hypothetical protein [Bdellovibrionales bacterium]